MDKYPLFCKFKERNLQLLIRDNETAKTLFEELVGQAFSKSIPLSSITGHEDIIAIVAKLGNIDKRFGKGETLLHWAVSNQPAYALPTSKVLVLLLLGADPNIQDVLGRTPLHWAVNHDCSDIAEDNDLRYERQCRSEAMKVVRQLLSFNASPNIVDTYGATPLCHAKWSNCFDIVDILRPLTDELLPSDPEFILTNTECAKSIRCSNVNQWIQENTSDVNQNKERLQRLLFSPGTGFLQHQEEVQMQKEQVLAFFRKISSNIRKEDPLLEFVPRLAGSMAEGTKCQKPDEQDIILRLTKFESTCEPEESEYAPHGVITLKFTGNDTERIEYEKYILDGYLNRGEILYSLLTKLEKEVSSTSLWSAADVMNIYPSHDLTVELRQAIEVGDIGNLTFVWHGKYYKHIRLSIDVVPAITLKDWRPDGVIIKDPIGKDVPKETFLILRSFTEDFEYDLEVYGELNDDTETLKNNTSALETLNGENWDSGSDCMSENGNDATNEDTINKVSNFYNTSLVREFRNDTGYSIPKTKRILRNFDAIIDERNDHPRTEDATKRFKTAAENDTILNPIAEVCSINEPFRNESGHFPDDSVCEIKSVTETEKPKYSSLVERVFQQTSDTGVINSTSSVNEEGQKVGTIRQESNRTASAKDQTLKLSESGRKNTDSKDSASWHEHISENACHATNFATDKKDARYNIEDDEISFEIQFGDVSCTRNIKDMPERHMVRFETQTETEDDGIWFDLVVPSEEKSYKVAKNSDTISDTLLVNDKVEESRKLETIMEQIFSQEKDETRSGKVNESHDDAISSSISTVEVDDDSEKDCGENDTDIDEDSSEEPREDMGFRISYSKWETDTMASFPYCIKSAYILSKALVSYIPEIRAPLNRGIHKNMKGYSAIKDLFSYMLKMALFSVVKRNQTHDVLKTDFDIKHGDEESGAGYSEKNVTLFEQLIYSRKSTCSSVITEENKIAPYPMNTNELKQIIFWVNEIFSEIEASTEKGCLSSYFDPKLNILERIVNAGKQKSKPYPSLLYIRKHCQMIRALARIEEDRPVLT